SPQAGPQGKTTQSPQAGPQGKTTQSPQAGPQGKAASQQAQRPEAAGTTAGLQGNARDPWGWVITEDEKTRYDDVFRARAGSKGFMAPNQAMGIFRKSRLDTPDLELVWTLADHSGKGYLDINEFAMAMNLIRRKLKGYPIPMGRRYHATLVTADKWASISNVAVQA
ncbi:hypothetical protein C8A05DRAFT_39603, partial [Staphylotrichum tortipilum]